MRFTAKRMVFAMLAGALLLAAAAGCAKKEQDPWLRVEDGKLMRAGNEYRGVGVNYFDAFYSAIAGSETETYEDIFPMLAEYEIPFARINLGVYWPIQFKAWDEDREGWFALMDDVLKVAFENNVGIIASLFWNYSMLPDYCGEPMKAWGDPESATREKMAEYTREIVQRYKDNPAIWAWEFGNEWNLMADLPNAMEHLPAIVERLGTPAQRTADDVVTTDIIASAMEDFTKIVREIDPVRMITSGNSVPRPSQFNQYESGTWASDTREEMVRAIGLHSAPDMDCVSFHIYEIEEQNRFLEGKTVEGLLAAAMEECAKLGKPLFAGEFGAQASLGEQTRPVFERMLRAIVDTKVPISAVWVVGRPSDTENEWNISPDNDRAYMLEAIRDANREIAGEGK